MKIKISSILNFFWPIQWLMQRIGKKEPLMALWQVQKIMSLVKPGDILLSYESQRLTSFFIKGDYDHAAITTAMMPDFVSLVEAVSPTVRNVDLEQWLFLKDSVVLIRPLVDDETRIKAGLIAKTFQGVKYDYSFSQEDPRLYCTELVWRSYANAKVDLLPNIIHDNMLPIEFYNHALKNEGMTIVTEIRNH